jgi:hypothetical protein
MDTSSTGGDSFPAFARLCWDERSGALVTGCVAGEDCLCVTSLLVVAVADLVADGGST